MVWPCREERVNAEGCDEVNYDEKETKGNADTKVARQHR